MLLRKQNLMHFGIDTSHLNTYFPHHHKLILYYYYPQNCIYLQISCEKSYHIQRLWSCLFLEYFLTFSRTGFEVVDIDFQTLILWLHKKILAPKPRAYPIYMLNNCYLFISMSSISFPFILFVFSNVKYMWNTLKYISGKFTDIWGYRVQFTQILCCSTVWFYCKCVNILFYSAFCSLIFCIYILG